MWNSPWVVGIGVGFIVLIGGTWFTKKIWPKADTPKKMDSIIKSEPEPEPEVTLSFYNNPPYNCVEMRNTGVEPIKKLTVQLIYKDNNGEEKQVTVEDFFEEKDTKMIWHQFKADTLKEMEVVRFRLYRLKSVMGGKMTVVVNFVGIRTNKMVGMKNEFALKL